MLVLQPCQTRTIHRRALLLDYTQHHHPSTTIRDSTLGILRGTTMENPMAPARLGHETESPRTSEQDKNPTHGTKSRTQPPGPNTITTHGHKADRSIRQE
eukprot:TRINITY_DN67359_c5_g1_i1.p2 TRINITY_DN67359_c5_g1~~TRINITY_DN67359_c5_g1_i1.p2  ORF type:complete len:100 (+),score=9.51 TRINITY_DN67359_c5_g1_i1:296-595(+)